jgi:CubicO group peptidase (beta-lactamase class C family)
MKTMTDVQRKVQKAIDDLVDSGAERGLQVAAYKDGRLIVDACAGVADPASGRKVASDTPFYAYSVGKAATATIVHRLVERGAFAYDTRVSELWPEFAARDKDEVTIRQVLNHTAGVPAIPPTTTIEDLCDWDGICAAVAEQELWWEPGTKIGYHAYNFGYILGEVCRRATGKPISELLVEEVCEPLGVEGEIWFGMPHNQQKRLAVLEDAPMDPAFLAQMAQMPKDLPMFRAAPMTVMPNAAMGNREDVLAADIPAGGKMTARAMAKLYAALIGEVDGVRLISAQTLREALDHPFAGQDQVFGMPTTWGLGYSIGRVGADSKTAFGVGGVGGSFAYADPASGVAFALMKNRLTQDFNAAGKVANVVEGSVS